MTVLKNARILHYGQADSTSIVFTAGRRQDIQTLSLVHTVLLTVIHFCDSLHISFCCTCKSLRNFFAYSERFLQSASYNGRMASDIPIVSASLTGPTHTTRGIST